MTVTVWSPPPPGDGVAVGAALVGYVPCVVVVCFGVVWCGVVCFGVVAVCFGVVWYVVVCSGVVWRAVVVRVVGFVVGSSENLRQVEVNSDIEEGNDLAINCGNLRAVWSEADIINCNVSCVVQKG